MKVVLFSRSHGRFQRSSGSRGHRGFDLEAFPLSELATVLPTLPESTLVYLDLKGLSAKERARVLAYIPQHPEALFGVIDPAGAVKDPARLFHAGAVDYLGRLLAAAGLTAKRVAAVLQYAGDGAEAFKAPKDRERPQEVMSGASLDGWGDIVSGREYQFAFLSVETDDAEELKKRHDPESLANAMDTFRGFIDRIVLQHGGRLWMWSHFGGLALFPLHGGGCSAVLCGMRILLSRVSYDVEESLLPGRLSFRMALSIGSTVYHARDTGKIVSDGVNSIFHLGRQFARPGQFLLTEKACALAPAPLRDRLVPAGSFEGRRIMRMLRPLPAALLAENSGGQG